jgi:FkbM family methyltransferase
MLMNSISLPFEVNLNAELSSWRAKSFWEKEPETIVWLDYFSNVSSPKIISLIDIGANIGMYSLYWLSRNDLTTCISCEPFFVNRQLLIENLHLNQFFSRTKIIASPISSKSELGIYEISDVRPGASSFKFSLGTEASEKLHHTTESMTVDGMLEECGSDKLQHILKIDVDGADFDVLKGAVNSLEKGLIISVLIESDEKQQGEIGKFLKIFGFDQDDRFNSVDPHSDNRRIKSGKIERNRVYSKL